MMMTDRARKLMKLLRRLIKKDHLYSSQQIIEMKSQLRMLEQEFAELDIKTSKGFKTK
jgi:hypothetical protein